MAKFFCYGTLKKDFSAHFILKNAPAAFYGDIKTKDCYHLYDVGDFPGVICDESKKGGVTGELYEVPQAAFDQLDKYECVGTGLFRRDVIELEDGTKAYAYIFNADMSNAQIIENGIWDKK